MCSSSGADRRKKEGYWERERAIQREGDEGEGRGKAAVLAPWRIVGREEEIEEDGDFGIFGNWRSTVERLRKMVIYYIGNLEKYSR